ncbi:MAG TPA: ATP synthase F0 subunit B [Kofleriaceae bacterium]|jgi:F-type H+-transporting ATPase subunit b|nr:ATP synthase F0 subunit B [Kofleriaceae bacterium]
MSALVRSLLLGAALVATPAIAVAQSHEPAAEAAHEAGHGAEAQAHGAAGEHGEAHGGGHHADPSKTFNWFDLGYRKKDQYGGKLGDKVQGPHDAPEEQMSPPFVLMLVNFGILLILLAKFGGKPARQMAENRADQIKAALDEASRLREAAQTKLEEYTTKLAAAQAEIQQVIDNMRATAEEEKQRILAAAEVQAAAVKREAEERIAAEIQRARAELAREVATAASAAAETLLRERATAQDQTRLVDTFLTQISSSQGAA